MSTQYPILDNRPINKWKVAELKEELKRRNLTVKGLKDDLVKRLDEAIRIERAAIEVEQGKGSSSERDHTGNVEDAKVSNSSVQMVDDVSEHEGGKYYKVYEAVIQMDIDDGGMKSDQNIALEEEATVTTEPITVIGESGVVEAPEVKDEVVLSHISSNKEAADDYKVGEHDEVSDSPEKDVLLSGELGTSGVCLQSSGEAVNSQIVSSIETLHEKKSKVYNNDDEATDLLPKKALENGEVNQENISLKSSHMAAGHDEPNSGDQVYDEVRPSLGFQVKSESFSTDILNVNEKKELKDNLNADNVQLETEIVRQEMLQPSPSWDLPGDGTLHPLGDPVPHGYQTLDGETDVDQSKTLETSKKNDNTDKFSVDVSVVEHKLERETTKNFGNDNEPNQISLTKDISPSHSSPQKLELSAEEKFDAAASVEERKPLELDDSVFMKMSDENGELQEKINFEQSSGDDSMEEDISETRLVDSEHNSIKAGEKSEFEKETDIGESGRIEVVQHLASSDKLESPNKHEDSVAALSAKRKFQDSTEAGSQEPLKRQHRWNTEGEKVTESQQAVVSLSMRAISSPQTASRRVSLTRSNSAFSEEAPKERVVPPSKETPTTSLRIDHFLRPFTLKAVQELLAKTGKVCSFWMDHIKTHCYVMYSSVEEAVETRNAVYNLQWPPNGGRHLIADFVDPEEVKLRLEAPSPSATTSANTSTSAVKSPIRQQGPMSQERQHPLSHQPPPRDPSTLMREQPARGSATVAEKIEPPISTLDDLFRKTGTTPRIYYLPLTDEQVAAKLARQRKDMR